MPIVLATAIGERTRPGNHRRKAGELVVAQQHCAVLLASCPGDLTKMGQSASIESSSEDPCLVLTEATGLNKHVCGEIV